MPVPSLSVFYDTKTCFNMARLNQSQREKTYLLKCALTKTRINLRFRCPHEEILHHWLSNCVQLDLNLRWVNMSEGMFFDDWVKFIPIYHYTHASGSRFHRVSHI